MHKIGLGDATSSPMTLPLFTYFRNTASNVIGDFSFTLTYTALMGVHFMFFRVAIIGSVKNF